MEAAASGFRATDTKTLQTNRVRRSGSVLVELAAAG